VDFSLLLQKPFLIRERKMFSLKAREDKDWILPATIYDRCPHCRSEELLVTDPISISCSECDWTNDQEFVEKGGMDKLMFLYEDDIIKSRSDEAKFMELIRFQSAAAS